MEARYIFRAHSPSINQYTKVVIIPLSQLKAGWFNSTAPAPSSSMTMDTMTVPAPLSKTMVLVSIISTETRKKYMTTALAPTANKITILGYQDTTVTVTDAMTAPTPSSMTKIREHGTRSINDGRDYYYGAGASIVFWGGDKYYNISWSVDDDQDNGAVTFV